MKPGRQRLLIPGLLVALLVVVAIVSGVRRADAAESTAVPTVPATKVSTINDARITESSGLAASMTHPGLAYTVNDSGDEARVFAVDIASGKVVGVTKVAGAQWADAEAMALWDGTLWIADVGNNQFSRHDQALYSFAEPGPGDHEVTASRYPLQVDGPSPDIEAMVVLPDRIDLYAKGWPQAYTLELPRQLRADAPNEARVTTRMMAPYASDATVTPDGRYVLIRNLALVEVHDAATWRVLHRDAIPVTDRGGETITVEPNAKSYLIGSEGANSPLLRIALDPTQWVDQPVQVIDEAAQVQAQFPIRTFVLRHLKPVALGVLALVGTLVAVVMVRRRTRRRRK